MESAVSVHYSIHPIYVLVEWTPDGHLRHSKFVGLREDKDPREVVREPG
jgi:ATP-dependent DNA ligase